ncbi:hypothetical protein SAMN05444277_1341 [Parafilimonas terrae]|uniref:DUF3108 domain-containing protein n=1 Tax=Parafilimonas terrae TaxID=1465490 RepID=A0A1I5ZIM0_9BACT|nr:hypothetical protein SAMN05444277_1341 [Parafilimonas terrae]
MTAIRIIIMLFLFNGVNAQSSLPKDYTYQYVDSSLGYFKIVRITKGFVSFEKIYYDSVNKVYVGNPNFLYFKFYRLNFSEGETYNSKDSILLKRGIIKDDLIKRE